MMCHVRAREFGLDLEVHVGRGWGALRPLSVGWSHLVRGGAGRVCGCWARRGGS